MFPFKSLLLGVFLFLFVNSVEPFPKLTPSACAHLKKVSSKYFTLIFLMIFYNYRYILMRINLQISLGMWSQF